MSDPLVDKLADKVLEYLATFPDGHESNLSNVLSQLASNETEFHHAHDYKTFVFHGVTLTHDETTYHLPVAVHERAGLHGIELEHLEDRGETDLPNIWPFAVRHIAV